MMKRFYDKHSVVCERYQFHQPAEDENEDVHAVNMRQQNIQVVYRVRVQVNPGTQPPLKVDPGRDSSGADKKKSHTQSQESMDIVWRS